MNISPYIKKFLCVILILVMSLPLSACRESPVLVEVVYIPQAAQNDPDQNSLDPSDDGQKDEDFSGDLDEEADRQREDQVTGGLSGQDSQAEHAADVQSNPNNNIRDHKNPTPGNDSKQESQAQKPSNNDSAGDQETNNHKPDESPKDEESSQGESNNGIPSESKEEESGEPETEIKEKIPTKMVTDATGNEVEVPENCHTAAAVGIAAQIVEMLGGELVAADSDLLSNSIAMSVLPDVYSAQALWTGNGSEGLDSYAFDTLLDLHPDVCFYVSGENTFSDKQLKRLAKEEIGVVALYSTASMDNITKSVTIAGRVLDGDAGQIAESYNAWVDSLLSGVESTTSDNKYTSLYVSSWDDSAFWQLGITKGVLPSSGSGLAVSYSPAKKQLISSMMSYANVTNESTRIKSLHKKSNYVYVTPLFHSLDAQVTGNQASYYSGAGEYGIAYDLFVARQSGSSYIMLGTSNYPAIVVADEATRTSIQNSWFWQYHEAGASGFIYVEGQDFYQPIYGEYDIYVNPKGMCDLGEGSLETPLEALWIASKFSGSYSMDTVYEKTKDFYSQFFGASLSDYDMGNIYTE